MVNAQEWLDEWCPKEGIYLRNDKVINIIVKKRSKTAVLCIKEKNLVGELDLSDFVNLERLDCSNNQFTSIKFLNTIPNPEKLEELLISDNNIQATDIAFFSKNVLGV